MIVGNICYVTECYNEVKFQLLLENHLRKRRGKELSDEFLTQCLAAYLECKNMPELAKMVSKMKSILDSMGIKYSDYRTYKNSEVRGIPAEAVQTFIELMKDDFQR